MTTRLERLALGEFYHIYNRGTDKRVIFKDSADYKRFMELLFLANSVEAVNVRDVRKTLSSIYKFKRGEPLVHIGAYCLMPNHFHILLSPAVENGVQTFMLKLSTGYSMYFNKKNIRTGTLFEGRFKSKHAGYDAYLKYLFAYIHLNPTKLIQPDWKEKGIADISKTKLYVERYPFSSLYDYTQCRRESVIVAPQKFPEYFASKKEIDEEILSWLEYAE